MKNPNLYGPSPLFVAAMKRFLRFPCLLILGLALAFITRSAHATSATWNGGGADGNWGTSGNWVSSTLPAATGASLDFGGTVNLSTTNNLVTTLAGSGTGAAAAIYFDSTAGAFTLSGNAITLTTNTGFFFYNASTSAETINNNLTLTSGAETRLATFGSGAGQVVFNGNINLNGSAMGNSSTTGAGSAGTIVLNGSNTGYGVTASGNFFDTPFTSVQRVQLYSSLGDTYVLGNQYALGSPNVSGTEGVVEMNSNTTFLANTNLSGVNAVDTSIALGNNKTLTIQGSNNLTIAGNIYNASNTAAGDTLSVTNAGTTVLSGTVFLSGTFNAKVLTANVTSNLSITGPIVNSNTTGTGSSLTKSGTGILTISGNDTYTGITTVSAGTLEADNEVSLYDNNTAGTGWTASNIIVASGATLTFQVGTNGSGYFTSSDIQTLGGLGGASNGFESGATLGIDTTQGNFNYANAISNPNSGANILGLNKFGANTLTLSGVNTYTGATTITAGTLSLSGTLGSGGGTAISNAATFSESSVGVISGTSTLTNVAGTTTLAGENTYSGATAITSGTLTIGSAGQLGATGTYSGNISNSGVFNYNSSAAQTLSGIISGSGTLIENGSGVLTLNGTNTYTGNIVVNSGTLAAAYGGNGVPSTSSALGNAATAGRTATINNGGAIIITKGNTLAGGNDTVIPGLSFVVNAGGTLATAVTTGGGPNGGDANVFGNVTLNGGTFTTGNGFSSTYQAAILLGSVTVGGASGSIMNTNGSSNNGFMLGGAVTGTNAITFNVASTNSGGADLTVSAKLTDSAGTVTGAVGGLIKAGAGTMALTATDSYSGGTTINAGTLIVSGSLSGAGAVTVESGATLAGYGGIAGPVEVTTSGTLAPASAALTTGTMTLSNNLQLDSSSTVALNLNAVNSMIDFLKTTGTLSIGSSDSLTVALLSNGTAGQTFEFATAGSITGSFANVTLTGYDASSLTASVVESGGDILTLDLAAVPEPQTWAMFLGGFISLVIYQRSRRRSRKIHSLP